MNLSRLFSLILTLTLSLPALAHVIQLPASALPDLVGKNPAPYSFFSIKDDRLQPVPHQWLPYSSGGFPWFSKDKSTKRDGTADVIDADDRLLLRRSDGGPPLAGRVSEDVIAELKISTANNTLHYYLVRNAYQQATQRYVRFDEQRMVVRSTDFSLSMEPGNILSWKDFFYRNFETASGKPETLLDTMKIRMSAGVFSENARITLTNSNLQPNIEEVVEGPLATAVFATTTLKVARVPVMRMRNYFLLMPQQTDIHTRFTLPLIAKGVLTPPEVAISMDGNQLYGSKLVTSWTGDKVAITDGKVSEMEQQMLAMPMQGQNWLWFGTGRGFDLLARLDFLEGFDQPVKLVYQDDATLENPPERFPGQLPNVGFSISDVPIGKEFYFLASLYFSNNSDGLGPGGYAAEILGEPQISWRMLSK